VTTVTTSVQPNPMMVANETSAVAPASSSSSSNGHNGHTNGYGRRSPSDEGYQSVADERNTAADASPPSNTSDTRSKGLV